MALFQLNYTTYDGYHPSVAHGRVAEPHVQRSGISISSPIAHNL